MVAYFNSIKHHRIPNQNRVAADVRSLCENIAINPKWALKIHEVEFHARRCSAAFRWYLAVFFVFASNKIIKPYLPCNEPYSCKEHIHLLLTLIKHGSRIMTERCTVFKWKWSVYRSASFRFDFTLYFGVEDHTTLPQIQWRTCI